jgi:hypothetical protein
MGLQLTQYESMNAVICTLPSCAFIGRNFRVTFPVNKGATIGEKASDSYNYR